MEEYYYTSKSQGCKNYKNICSHKDEKKYEKDFWINTNAPWKIETIFGSYKCNGNIHNIKVGRNGSNKKYLGNSMSCAISRGIYANTEKCRTRLYNESCIDTIVRRKAIDFQIPNKTRINYRSIPQFVVSQYDSYENTEENTE